MRKKPGTKRRDKALIAKRPNTKKYSPGPRQDFTVKVGGREDGGYDEVSEEQIKEAILEARRNDRSDYW